MLVTARPRLLFISPRFLFPMNEGGKIRTANILRNLKGGAFEVTLASPAPENLNHFTRDVGDVCDSFVSWPARKASRRERLMALAAPIPVGVAAADWLPIRCAELTSRQNHAIDFDSVG